MTGAGVSAASGIPTFRGADGFYSKTVDDETGLVQYYFNIQRILRRLWLGTFIKKIQDNVGNGIIDSNNLQ